MSTENDTEETSTAIAAYEPHGTEIGDPLWDPQMFAHMWRVAQMFAASRLVPDHLRGKPNDCFLAVAMAKRSDQEPLAVLQSIYFVSGKAGWSSTYLIARAKVAGMPIRWDLEDNGAPIKVGGKTMRNRKVTAWAMVDGERVEATITSEDAHAEGWTKNAKYFTLTDQMLQYRTATLLVRLYMPEVLLGLPAIEEVETIVVEQAPMKQGAEIRASLAAAKTLSIAEGARRDVEEFFAEDEELAAQDEAEARMSEAELDDDDDLGGI